MTSKSFAHRLAKIQAKRLLTIRPLVIIYQSTNGLSYEQQCRVNDAKAENRPVRLIRTFVNNE